MHNLLFDVKLKIFTARWKWLYQMREVLYERPNEKLCKNRVTFIPFKITFKLAVLAFISRIHLLNAGISYRTSCSTFAVVFPMIPLCYLIYILMGNLVSIFLLSFSLFWFFCSVFYFVLLLIVLCFLICSAFY